LKEHVSKAVKTYFLERYFSHEEADQFFEEGLKRLVSYLTTPAIEEIGKTALDTLKDSECSQHFSQHAYHRFPSVLKAKVKTHYTKRANKKEDGLVLLLLHLHDRLFFSKEAVSDGQTPSLKQFKSKINEGFMPLLVYRASCNPATLTLGKVGKTCKVEDSKFHGVLTHYFSEKQPSDHHSYRQSLVETLRKKPRRVERQLEPLLVPEVSRHRETNEPVSQEHTARHQTENTLKRLKTLNRANFKQEYLEPILSEYGSEIPDNNRDNTRYENRLILLKQMTQLLGKENIAFNSHHYLAQLTSKSGMVTKHAGMFTQQTVTEAGVPPIVSPASAVKNLKYIYGISLDGWNPQDFLASRLLFMFEQLVQLVKGGPSSSWGNESRNTVKEKLIQEIIYGAQAFWIDVLNEQAHQSEDKEKQRTLLAKVLVHRIAALQDGELLYFSTGFDEHTVYINFECVKAKKGGHIDIVIRVDNLRDNDCIEYEHDVARENSNIKFKPKRIAVMSQENFKSAHPKCSEYLFNVLAANFKPEREGLELIYHPNFSELDQINVELDLSWQYKKSQIVRNCVVKSHNIGVLQRFFVDGSNQQARRALYKTLRTEEKKFAIDETPKERVVSR